MPYLPLGPGKVLFNLGTDTVFDVLIRSSISRNPGEGASASGPEGCIQAARRLPSPFLVRPREDQVEPLGWPELWGLPSPHTRTHGCGLLGVRRTWRQEPCLPSRLPGPCSPLVGDRLFCCDPLVLLYLHQPCDQVLGWGQSQAEAQRRSPTPLSRVLNELETGSRACTQGRQQAPHTTPAAHPKLDASSPA